MRAAKVEPLQPHYPKRDPCLIQIFNYNFTTKYKHQMNQLWDGANDLILVSVSEQQSSMKLIKIEQIC